MEFGRPHPRILHITITIIIIIIIIIIINYYYYHGCDMAINHSSSHILATSTLEKNPPAMPTTCTSTSKTRSGCKRPISPLPSTTTGQKRKNSNVDEEPAQAKTKKKTATKMSKQGKGKASKRNGKES